MAQRIVLVLAGVALGLTLGASALRSQTALPTGAFVRGPDGTGYVISPAGRHPIAWTDDDGSNLDALAEAEPVASIEQANALLGLGSVATAPPPPPAPTARPAPPPALAPRPTTAPAPSTPADGLVGTTVSGLCSSISRSTFTATVERAIWTREAVGQTSAGVYVIVIARVTNDGSVPDDAFAIARLIDNRNRSFSSLSSSDFRGYFDLVQQYGVRSSVTNIQPGLSGMTLWIFEVPPDVQSLRLASGQGTCRR